MIALAFSLPLLAGMFLTLHGGLRSAHGTTIAGFDLQSMGMGLVALLAAGVVFGPLYGLALILSVMLHEFGHVAAYRIAGHGDARFRLIPLMGGVANSDRAPATDEHAFFIALMGPGICLAPMVAAYALAGVTWDISPALADFLWTFAVTTAALNFFNLLPIWPLDGGRCLRIIARSFWPGSATIVTLAMSGALVALAIHLQSMLLLAFALLGSQSLFQAWPHLDAPRRMGPLRGLLALGCYGFTTATHFVGGAWLLSRLV